MMGCCGASAAAGPRDGAKDATAAVKASGNFTGAASRPVLAAEMQYFNNYDGDNPRTIRADPVRSNNYLLVIGDWGRAGGPGPCQTAVAEKMKAYVAQQKAAGKTLLAILSVGDNFYWSGVLPVSWQSMWARPYGTLDADSPLFNVTWLAVLGNHDFGDDDPFAFCPYAQAQAMATFAGQSYGSAQLNADKNPERPANTDSFWLPDYNYHYAIPEADLEVIAIDTNFQALGGLGGDYRGHTRSFMDCGGANMVEHFLSGVARAGMDLVLQRARANTASTVVIMQHYPGACPRDEFYGALPVERHGKVHVICTYGHVHEQKCKGKDTRGQCNDILSGGGGGCCAPSISSAGFAAVSLTDDGAFTADVESPSVAMPAGQCHWRRRLQVKDSVKD